MIFLFLWNTKDDVLKKMFCVNYPFNTYFSKITNFLFNIILNNVFI